MGHFVMPSATSGIHHPSRVTRPLGDDIVGDPAARLARQPSPLQSRQIVVPGRKRSRDVRSARPHRDAPPQKQFVLAIKARNGCRRSALVRFLAQSLRWTVNPTRILPVISLWALGDTFEGPALFIPLE